MNREYNGDIHLIIEAVYRGCDKSKDTDWMECDFKFNVKWNGKSFKFGGKICFWKCSKSGCWHDHPRCQFGPILEAVHKKNDYNWEVSGCMEIEETIGERYKLQWTGWDPHLKHDWIDFMRSL